MTERTSSWLMVGVSMAFVAMGAFLFWDTRDPMAVACVLFFGACGAVGWMKLREGRMRHRDHWLILEGDSITLRRSVGTIRLYALIGIAMGAGCGGIAYANGSIIAVIAGVAGMLLFAGGGLCILVTKGCKAQIALHVDAQGIGFGRKPHPRIAWDNLDSVGVVSASGEPHLGFMVRDHDALHAEQGASARMGTAFGQEMGLPDFVVAQIGLDVPLDRVALAIDRLWRQYT